MISALIIAALMPTETRILLIGNSHTATSEIPALVKSLFESDGTKRSVATKFIWANFLNDGAKDQKVVAEIKTKRWNTVILQGAMLSSSHKYEYSQDGAIQLARLARASGANALLFAEWPRRGWDETAYIMGIYGRIAKASGAEIIPVCMAWGPALKERPTLELWAGDGNHTTPQGAYLAALTIAYFLGANPGPWRPSWVDEETANVLRRAARKALRSPESTFRSLR